MIARTLILAACLGLLGSTAKAQVSPATAISDLLSVGWDIRPEGRARAAAAYQQAVEDLPGDRQIVYAYALVRMQQRQYPEAVRLLEDYLSIEKEDAQAWRAKAWLAMLMKNASSSLVDLDKISQLVADEKTELTAAERQELIGFLGRMIGFLEGPGEGAVNSSTLSAAKRKIVDRLTPTQRETFDQNVSAVIDEFGVLATAKDDAQVQEIATAEKRKRDQLAQLDKDAIEIGARKEELKLAAERIESEAQADNDTYSRADQPLAESLANVNSQALIAERELANVSVDLLSLRAQFARERDPIIRDRLFREIDRVEILAARIDADLLSLRRRAQGIQAQRGTLAAKHNQAQASFAAGLAKAQKEFQTLENQLKRASAERSKLKRPAVGNTGKIIALNKQAVALSTYETFPLEAEKQRLLDQLEAK